MLLKIGKINYANLYPIFYTLEKECGPSLCRFVEGVPSEINRLLREGALDISPSSSIEYLRRPDEYVLIEGHSINSTGPIESILLFSKSPLKDLDGGIVFASDQSETSTALLRIILKKFFGIDAKIVVSGTDMDLHFAESAAHMLIGDDALRARKDVRRRGPRGAGEMHGDAAPYIYDLGDLWYKNTGLPFVFALWMGVRERFESGAFAGFVDMLDSAKRFAVGNFDAIARDNPYAGIMSAEELISYWKNISYDLDEGHKKGLNLFKEYLTEEGIL